jgi:predicted TIM-barrel fold metal-dependent hydrolase
MSRSWELRTIAIEEHFLSAAAAEAMKRDGAPSRSGGANEAIMAERQAKLMDLGEVRLADMDAAGIDLQVISHTAFSLQSPLPEAESVRLAIQANDQLATAIAAHPTRFAGFAILPMTSPAAAADELERAVRSLGFKGAMINGTTVGRFLGDGVFLPILERAVALDVPVYLHPAPPPAPVWEAYYAGFDLGVSSALATSGWGWHAEVAVGSLRLILSGVFDRLPGLRIIIGHMGEMLPFMLARIENVLTPVARHLQRPVSDYLLRNFHYTTSGFFTDPPLLLAIATLGADRIIFSIDYPYSTNQQGRAFLDSASLSPADKEKISHVNAEELLLLPGA